MITLFWVPDLHECDIGSPRCCRSFDPGTHGLPYLYNTVAGTFCGISPTITIESGKATLKGHQLEMGYVIFKLLKCELFRINYRVHLCANCCDSARENMAPGNSELWWITMLGAYSDSATTLHMRNLSIILPESIDGLIQTRMITIEAHLQDLVPECNDTGQHRLIARSIGLLLILVGVS